MQKSVTGLRRVDFVKVSLGRGVVERSKRECLVFRSFFFFFFFFFLLFFFLIYFFFFFFFFFFGKRLFSISSYITNYGENCRMVGDERQPQWHAEAGLWDWGEEKMLLRTSVMG